MTRRALVSALLLPASMAWVIGCLDNSGPTGIARKPALDTLPGLVVSHPVSGIGAAAASRQTITSSAPAGSNLVYVSLIPGSVPTGLHATIRDQATGMAVTTVLTEGGFDPVPIAASDGDTLEVDVVVIGSTNPLRGQEVVAANRPPVVIRTSPPRGGRDVPLNALMVIVFSVPMDPATVDTGSVRLLHNSIPVAGTVVFADSTHLTAQFRLAAPLSPQTTYRLVAAQGIRDVNGIALDSAFTTSFTTGSYPLPSLVSIAPAGAPQGSAAFTLRVNGSGFLPASIVKFGATALATTYVDSVQLTAAVPASAIATASEVAVSVTTPAPGGGTSDTVIFDIAAPATIVPFRVSPASLDFGFQVVSTPSAPKTVTVTNVASVPESLSIGLSNSTLAGLYPGDIGFTSACPRTLASGASCTISLIFTPSAPRVAYGNLFVSPAPQQDVTSMSLQGTGLGGLSLAVVPSRSGQGKFLYLSNAITNSVSMYAIDSATGALTPLVPSRIGAGVQPASLVVDPSGRFAYVANAGSNDVSMYSINSVTGTLSQIGSPVPAGLGPVSVAVAPDRGGTFGRFVYVMNDSSRSLSMYSIDSATGALTSIGSFRPGDWFPAVLSVAVHPSGKFVYVASNGCTEQRSANCVFTYAVNPATGALTASGLSYPGGGEPSSMAVDPYGRFLIVADDDPSDYTMAFGIDTASGSLASLNSLNTEQWPTAVTIDASGRFVYETTAGFDTPPCSYQPCSAVWILAVDASANLTSVGTIAAGQFPTAVVTDPSGRFAYVGNVGSQDISMYRIGADGTLTLIGTIGL